MSAAHHAPLQACYQNFMMIKKSKYPSQYFSLLADSTSFHQKRHQKITNSTVHKLCPTSGQIEATVVNRSCLTGFGLFLVEIRIFLNRSFSKLIVWCRARWKFWLNLPFFCPYFSTSAKSIVDLLPLV